MENNKKTKRFFIALFCISLLSVCGILLTPTLSKYISDVRAPWKDGDEDHSEIDYTVNSVYEVKNEDGLFAAINQGYSYIQLSKSIQNPLIVVQKMESLSSDLILDLNGAEIQRNGYDPILDIKPGVRLTVIDTSEEQTGGLYNPVGSVFKLSGGKLNVVKGTFEVGPRYSEYYSYNSTILRQSDPTKRTTVAAEPQQVRFYSKNSDSYEPKSAPVIQSYPETYGEIVYNHGNLYFDQDVIKGDVTISSDTYCYYHTSADALSAVSDPVSADWNYRYFVTKNGAYHAAELSEGESKDDFIEVTIYGYENAIKQAQNKAKIEEQYAAIKMQGGILDVQKGDFCNYFGTKTTACVSASGGELKVRKGNFSTRIPDAVSSSGNVVLKEDDSAAFDENYFSCFSWQNESFSAGAIVRLGEGYCIKNTGDAVLRIDDGKFYSSNNNIIGMLGGSLITQGGVFTKKCTLALSEFNEKSAAIYMEKGTLNIEHAYCSVTGGYSAAIYMKDGLFTFRNSTCRIKGSNTYGIYSTVRGENQFSVLNSSLSLIEGIEQVGIYAENGKVKLSADTAANISAEGDDSTGIYVTSGGSVDSVNYSYLLKGARSEGIHSTGGHVSMHGGKIDLESNTNCYGVYVETSVGSPEILLSDMKIYAGNDTLNANVGSVDATIGVYLKTDGSGKIILDKSVIHSNEIGVAVNGGSLFWTGGGELKAYNGSAIAMRDGKIAFGNSDDTASEFAVLSKINGTKNTSGYNSSTEHAYEIKIAGEAYDNLHGVYISGGSFFCYGILDFSFDGLCNDDQANDSYDPLGNVTRSFAVHVKAAVTSPDIVNFSMANGRIDVSTGGGVWVSGGGVELGDEKATVDNTSLSIITTGTEMYTNPRGSSYDNWKYYVSKTGGPALKVTGGNLSLAYGSYISARGKALLVENGNVTVKKGNFVGGSLPDIKDDISQIDTKGKSYNVEASGLACFYGLFVSGSGNVTVENGNFLGQNGGGFFYGNDAGNACIVDIKKGNFLSVYNASGSVLGLCGVCVMGNVRLNLNEVYMNAVNAAISVEGNAAVNVDNSQAQITIIGGEYITAGGAVIFNYGTSTKHASWIIKGGHFKTANGARIFQTQWGSYAPAWSEILGEGYLAYSYNGNAYSKIGNQDTTGSTAYYNVFVSDTTPE